jgi:phage gpG-like protein
MNFEELKRKILKDIKVEVSEEFDKNFERKAFFTKPWKPRKTGQKGSLMEVRGGGGLRGSIRAQIVGDTIEWTSSLPYAGIHNEGGEITVTAKMKRFFWAKYYELSGKIRYKKDRKASKATLRYSREAEFYKNLALMQVGSRIVIPGRRFIGNAPEVEQACRRAQKPLMDELEKYIAKELKQRKS